MNALLLLLMMYGSNIDVHITNLTNDDYLVRKQAREALVEIGIPAIEKLRDVKPVNLEEERAVTWVINKYFETTKIEISVWHLPEQDRFYYNDKDQKVDRALEYYKRAYAEAFPERVLKLDYCIPVVEREATQLLIKEMLNQNKRKEVYALLQRMIESEVCYKATFNTPYWYSYFFIFPDGIPIPYAKLFDKYIKRFDRIPGYSWNY